MRTGLALILVASGLSLSACAGAQAVGTSPAYAEGYYAGAPYNDLCWTNGWAGTFNYPYCGWYNGFFYPGSGAYIYDHNRRPHAITPAERNHWAGRGPTVINGMHSPGPVRSPGSIGGENLTLSSGMHGPGPVRTPGNSGGNGFGLGRPGAGAGTGGGRRLGGGRGGSVGGSRGFGGGRGARIGGGRGFGGGHGGRG